jgi:hypothetical protein
MPILIMMLLAACSSYGDKVQVNDKSEVYYARGATEEDAKKVGAFLLRLDFFDDQTERSVQVLKVKETYILNFPIDEERMKNNHELLVSLHHVQALLRDSVFNGKPTKLVLTNDEFKDLQNYKQYTGEAVPVTNPSSTNSQRTKQ